MKHIALFFHLLGLSVWGGSLIAMAICVTGLRSERISRDIKQMLNKAQGKFTLIGNLGALAMLTSGFALFSMSHTHAIWVDLMAGIGGALCIFSLIAISLQSNILSGRIKSNLFDDLLNSQIGLIYFSSWFVMIGIVVVLGVVSYRV
ncbi:hypothetical protein NZD89_20100 [Alicyclobacillus fastidiosus]|uniref:DUF2269 family protein n=1 Tax=Alicyclobacillus fastidiosus TaxID=392011 RepID=A0ABY6ZCM8_9BACL|nr:hypothetical protein [Alicyclobacillus fastidiosus]WAH40599.1 hypothetical protein NZD89_20100 [Alicyclobacillus fastidiosus]GMA62036.1 hypothetical protein GCM10025859_24760 [Alicyclobacillus fastidiosus]